MRYAIFFHISQTVYLFRALNVPLNVHRLRAMRAKGKLPAPLLKFRYGTTKSKHVRSASAPGKENKDIQLTGILKVPGTNHDPHDDPEQESPTEMETVQGECWYLPSATARRMTRQRSRIEDEYNDHIEQDRHNWESPYPTPRELRMQDIPAPQPVIPNQALLDQFPLPPSTLPSITGHAEPFRIPLPPTPSPAPTTSSAPSPSRRPLGYMYAPARSLRRTPSCKSCGGGGSPPSPAPPSSVSTSRTTSPALPVLPRDATGCYYAYDLLTPSPGALPYSGYAPVRSVSPNYYVAFVNSPIPH